VDQVRFADRLSRYLRLTNEERSALERLEESERSLPRGALLRTEHAMSRELYMVERGWLFCSMLLSDGNRQILSLHLPGDLAGDTALPWTRAPFSLTAATDVTVRVIDKAALRRLFEQQPRLGLLVYMLAQAERVALADRLASVGRPSAKARVAALILDTMCRLRANGVDTKDGYVLPLTQEEIGDATGLTAVHVNRMMRQLVEDKLITRTSGRICVMNEARLAQTGNYTDRFREIDTSWLPDAP
jgi:CRP/FNR family transcriptional regulator